MDKHSHIFANIFFYQSSNLGGKPLMHDNLPLACTQKQES